MTEKKVIAFIVEGASDEAALGTIMKEYFTDNEVQFVVIRGGHLFRVYLCANLLYYEKTLYVIYFLKNL